MSTTEEEFKVESEAESVTTNEDALAPPTASDSDEQDDTKPLDVEDGEQATQDVDTMDTGAPDQPDSTVPPRPRPITIELPEYGRTRAPKINCPEKIIIAIDVSSEVNTTSFVARSAPDRTMFMLLKKAIRSFIRTKAKINPRHEFAFAVLEENASVFHQFSRNTDELCQALEDLQPSYDQHFESFDLGSLIGSVRDLVQVPEVDDLTLPPPYIVRVIVIYSRSHVMPSLSEQGIKELVQLLQSPYFYLDLLYTHERPSEENHCEAIYDQFCDLDQHEVGYMLEVSRSTTRLFDHMAKLVAHPLQRMTQRHTYYKLTKQNDEELV